MVIAYKSFLASEPFRIIGPEGGVFFCHRDLLAGHSDVLAAEVEGEMQEAKQKEIRIEEAGEDLDDSTVMRFIEFAYTGDYTVPKPDVLLSSANIADKTESMTTSHTANSSPVQRNMQVSAYLQGHHDLQPPALDYEIPLEDSAAIDGLVEVDESELYWGWTAPAAGKCKCRCKKCRLCRGIIRSPPPELEPEPEIQPAAKPIPRTTKRDLLWSSFCDRATVKNKISWEPKPNSDPGEDFGQVFLCHARLYVFSDRYQCAILQDLTIQKLRLTLARFTLHDQQISNVIELLRYTYRHTVQFENSSDKLRELVIDFAVCATEKLVKHPSFSDLLKEDSEMGRDLVLKLVGRLD